MENFEMPMGFGIALAQNFEAMQKFTTLSDEQKKKIIEGTHAVNSREEMRRYIDRVVLGRKELF